MLVKIAAERRPEKTLLMMFPACQIPMRSGDSSFVYHDDVISATTGRKGPSVTPTRKRHSMKAHGDLAAGMAIVTADHANMMQGMMTRGLCFEMMTLPGTCEMI
jgi:hypothetical protein